MVGLGLQTREQRGSNTAISRNTELVCRCVAVLLKRKAFRTKCRLTLNNLIDPFAACERCSIYSRRGCLQLTASAPVALHQAPHRGRRGCAVHAGASRAGDLALGARLFHCPAAWPRGHSSYAVM
jgi:hypothetical protein